jgi:hypothetical protein
MALPHHRLTGYLALVIRHASEQTGGLIDKNKPTKSIEKTELPSEEQ